MSSRASHCSHRGVQDTGKTILPAAWNSSFSSFLNCWLLLERRIKCPQLGRFISIRVLQTSVASWDCQQTFVLRFGSFVELYAALVALFGHLRKRNWIKKCKQQIELLPRRRFIAKRCAGTSLIQNNCLCCWLWTSILLWLTDSCTHACCIVVAPLCLC